MMMSSSPVSSLCVYKLFSSCRVWSRTLCMPRFSSLADDNFSGEKNKGDTVNPQLLDYVPDNITPVYSFLQVCHRAAFAAQHSACQMCQMCNKCVSLAFLVTLCFMHKHPHTKKKKITPLWLPSCVILCMLVDHGTLWGPLLFSCVNKH